MTLSERIRTLRQKAGLTQEQVAGALGISRQAVAKWESGLSAPSTNNLLRLAEVLGVGAEELISPAEEEGAEPSTAEELYRLYRRDEEERAALRRVRRKKNILAALSVAGGYLLIYLIGRIVWCDLEGSSFLGWLILARPAGEHSYLYSWLLHQRLFWWAMAVSALPALWGKLRFSLASLCGFALGLILGILLGPVSDPQPFQPDHYGWAIWGGTFLLSLAAGAVWQRLGGRRSSP